MDALSSISHMLGVPPEIIMQAGPVVGLYFLTAKEMSICGLQPKRVMTLVGAMIVAAVLLSTLLVAVNTADGSLTPDNTPAAWYFVGPVTLAAGVLLMVGVTGAQEMFCS